MQAIIYDHIRNWIAELHHITIWAQEDNSGPFIWIYLSTTTTIYAEIYAKSNNVVIEFNMDSVKIATIDNKEWLTFEFAHPNAIDSIKACILEHIRKWTTVQAQRYQG